ncbi:hypothetical protein ACTHGU_03605 [Chitinophagaceae bacterium MMS25-I14]
MKYFFYYLTAFLSPLLSQKDVTVFDTYVKVREGVYSSYSKQILIDGHKYGYLYLCEVIPSINECYLMTKKTKIINELDALIKTSDSIKLITDLVYKTVYIDSSDVYDKVESDFIYEKGNRDTICVSYKANAVIYFFQKPLSDEMIIKESKCLISEYPRPQPQIFLISYSNPLQLTNSRKDGLKKSTIKYFYRTICD